MSDELRAGDRLFLLSREKLGGEQVCRRLVASVSHLLPSLSWLLVAALESFRRMAMPAGRRTRVTRRLQLSSNFELGTQACLQILHVRLRLDCRSQVTVHEIVFEEVLPVLGLDLTHFSWDVGVGARSRDLCRRRQPLEDASAVGVPLRGDPCRR